MEEFLNDPEGKALVRAILDRKLEDVAARGLEKASAYTAPDISPALIRWPEHRQGPQEFIPEWAWPTLFGVPVNPQDDFISTLIATKEAMQRAYRGQGLES